jgi:hypothetical protein
LGHPVRQDLLAREVHQATQEPLEDLDQQDFLDLKEPVVKQDKVEILVPLDHQDQEGLLDLLDHKDPLVILELLAPLDPQAHKGPEEKQV